jgi:hypothetical protein
MNEPAWLSELKTAGMFANYDYNLAPAALVPGKPAIPAVFSLEVDRRRRDLDA